MLKDINSSQSISQAFIKLITILVSMTSNEKLFSSWVSGGFSCSCPWPYLSEGQIFSIILWGITGRTIIIQKPKPKGKDVQKWTTNCLSGLHIIVYELGVDSMFTSLLSKGEEPDSTSWVQAWRQAAVLGELQDSASSISWDWLLCCQNTISFCATISGETMT